MTQQRTLSEITTDVHMLIEGAIEELRDHFKEGNAFLMKVEGKLDTSNLDKMALPDLVGDAVYLEVLNNICYKAIKNALEPLYREYDNWVVNHVESTAKPYNPDEALKAAEDKETLIKLSIDRIKADLLKKGLRGILEENIRKWLSF